MLNKLKFKNGKVCLSEYNIHKLTNLLQTKLLKKLVIMKKLCNLLLKLENSIQIVQITLKRQQIDVNLRPLMNWEKSTTFSVNAKFQ